MARDEFEIQSRRVPLLIPSRIFCMSQGGDLTVERAWGPRRAAALLWQLAGQLRKLHTAGPGLTTVRVKVVAI